MLKVGWPEPALALRGGADGTDLAARLIRSAPARLAPGGWLVLEASPPQFTRLYALMDQAGFHSIDVEKDLAGSDRVIAGRLDRPTEEGKVHPLLAEPSGTGTGAQDSFHG